MPAHAEARRQARPVDRRAHQGLAHRLALGVEEVVDPALGREAVHVQAPAGQRQRGVEHVLGLGEAAVFLEQRLVEHLEAVAGLELALEIHVEAEDPDHLHQDRHGQPGAPRGIGKIVLDGAVGAYRQAQKRPLDRLGGEAPGAGPRDPQVALDVGLQAERQQAARRRRSGGGEPETDLLAGL